MAKLTRPQKRTVEGAMRAARAAADDIMRDNVLLAHVDSGTEIIRADQVKLPDGRVISESSKHSRSFVQIFTAISELEALLGQHG